ncbi:ABC transporter permease [Actinoallomurus vinaceus]|uniref:ABC transporter permease n=1 Tax=Actinoallomurus vinaceus TaxID=1080074 RepID=A0ABP8UT15_9ACTN
MTRVALKALWARKRRLAGSFVAVFLGVSFLTGTLVLGDTLNRSIGRFFAQAYAGTDVSVRNATSVSDGPGAIRGPVDASVADRVRGVPGVAAAEPVIQGIGQLLGRDGRPIEVLGPRTAGNWLTDPRLNPYHLVEGRAPYALDEVVVNRAVARQGRLRVGDVTAVLTPRRIPVRIVGLAKFGDQDGFGGTSFTAFTLEGARRYVAGSPDRVTSVSIRAAAGVPQAALAERVRRVLPPGTEAVTGRALGDEGMSAVAKGFLTMFRAFLLVFAGVALLVGSLSIHNTFSITVAQRVRESALLRALGASRRQVLGSVVVEALAVGLVASLAGVLGGLGFATLLGGVFAAMGAALPVGGLVLTPGTVAVAVPVGLLVTLLAGLVPAVHAARTPPLAALRETAAEPPGVPRARAVAGGALLAICVALVLASVVAGDSMPVAGAAALVGVVGMVVFGPVAARYAAALLGVPLRRLTGTLARRNAVRAPRRTAGAATALMVGVGVVTLVTVLAASSEASVRSTVARSFGGDLVISATGTSSTAGFSPRLADDVARLPQTSAAAGVGVGDLRIGGRPVQVRYADPAALGRVIDLGPAARIGPGRFAVAEDVAAKRGWHAGTPVNVRFADGTSRALTVGGIYPSGGPIGGYLIPRAEWTPHDRQPQDTTVLITLRGGTDLAAAKRAVTDAARPYGAPSVRDRAAYLDAQASGVRQLLTLVYVLLALAIVIALLGIANTLSLSVHERTRELGLLRAVGMTRAQLRSMVRWESLIMAVFGTAGGLGLGLLLGWAVGRAASDGAFAAPVAQLAIIAVVGALAGVVAAVRPARRAARLDVLAAIATA